jgi:hypothetical protein
MDEKMGTRIPLKVVPNKPMPKKEPMRPAAQMTPRAPPLEIIIDNYIIIILI